MPSLNIPVEPELLEKAKKMAKKKGISLAGFVRMLIILEAEKEEAKGKG
jgi:predicted HicB family RNase H-like nuclease